MTKNIIVGIDIGTHATRVVVTRLDPETDMPRILGTGFAPSLGMRHGYIVNERDAATALRSAILDAEKNSGEKIRSASFAIGGVSLGSHVAYGSTVISKADGEITSLDVKKAIETSEHAFLSQIKNRKIIHAIPLSFALDGHELLARPIGMSGSKLEVKTLFISCLKQHFEDLLSVASLADVDAANVVASPFAASMVALTKKQKIAGCALVNIGAETVSLAVFENDTIISLEVFPIGSTDVTNDIALGFQIPLDEADRVKTGADNDRFPKKKIEEIINARLSDIFELIENHLKKIKRNGLLPAGIVITGGGSAISSIDVRAREALSIPSSITNVSSVNAMKGKIKDSTWFVAYGLCVNEGGADNVSLGEFSIGLNKIKEWANTAFRQFLP